MQIRTTMVCAVLGLGLATSAARADGLDVKIEGATTKPGVKASGKSVLHVIKWTDARGANVAVLSETRNDRKGTAAIYIDHYAGLKKLKKVKTAREVSNDRCLTGMSAEGIATENDSIAEFIPATFAVTDTDGDKVGELMIGYRAGCVLNGHLTGKVLVLEGGAKHAWRGTVQIDDTGGYMLADDEKTDLEAPAALISAGEAAWKHLADEDPGS
jgi:hypothetical protein